MRPFDASIARPRQHRVGGQFGAIVADDHPGRAALGDQVGQIPHHPLAQDRRVGHRPHARRSLKVALGLLGGAAIRLAPATDELGLAEGVEDALSAMEWFGTPTWALGGIERLALGDIPAQVRHIIVYGDRGKAAEAGLERARAPDRERANAETRVPETMTTGTTHGVRVRPSRRMVNRSSQHRRAR